ncbi:hypothetical protein ACFVIM_20705 [Streptomyces sp. NPDC057638]|uniref:hypothetical protein n=1 Tax=Streptomyces sp. NPDC057638 TaxID=3346190 RepID=UPI00368AA2C0
MHLRGAVGVVVALALHSLMYGPQAAFIAEQFDPRLRYTGSSLAYTLAGVIGGAVAPLLFTALLDAFDSWVPLALYLALTAVVTVTGLLLGRDAPAEEHLPEPMARGTPATTASHP